MSRVCDELPQEQNALVLQDLGPPFAQRGFQLSLITGVPIDQRDPPSQLTRALHPDCMEGSRLVLVQRALQFWWKEVGHLLGVSNLQCLGDELFRRPVDANGDVSLIFLTPVSTRDIPLARSAEGSRKRRERPGRAMGLNMLELWDERERGFATLVVGEPAGSLQRGLLRGEGRCGAKGAEVLQ